MHRHRKRAARRAASTHGVYLRAAGSRGPEHPATDDRRSTPCVDALRPAAMNRHRKRAARCAASTHGVDLRAAESRGPEHPATDHRRSTPRVDALGSPHHAPSPETRRASRDFESRGPVHPTTDHRRSTPCVDALGSATMNRDRKRAARGAASTHGVDLRDVDSRGSVHPTTDHRGSTPRVDALRSVTMNPHRKRAARRAASTHPWIYGMSTRAARNIPPPTIVDPRHAWMLSVPPP
jgi:hypothetical protein